MWNGMRVTASNTGKRTPDGRLLIFLPTASNVTSGLLMEVEPEGVTQPDEHVEDALARI